ncbi:MAG: hypothetical protein ACKVUT_08645 [Gaiella sp.]
MKNPLRDEGAAFRVVIGAAVAGALVALGAWIDKWAGIGVLVALTVAFLVWLRGELDNPAPPIEVAPEPGRHRVLVVANETVGAPLVRETVASRVSPPGGRVFVVCPALNSRLRTWVSDEDAARRHAELRLATTLEAFRSLGIEADGMIGDGDPLQAVEDALRVFPADELVVSTHPPGRSNWLESGVVDRIRRRVAMPVTHLVPEAAAAARAGDQLPAALET